MSTLEIFENAEYEEKEFIGLSLAQANLTESVFENCIFTRCHLSGANLTRARFISCKFIACDLSNAVIKNGRIRDTSFKDCKLLGIQWIHLDDFVNPTFDDCHLSYCNFVGLKLKKTLFLKCSLKEVDFSQTDLTGSDLRESDLLKARFSQTILLKCDFRGSFNYTIDPLANKVQGARFSLPEAQGLLVGLGVIIE